LQDRVRVGVATEIFLSEDTFARDIRVYTFAFEVERHLTEGLWLRGSMGPTLTRGTRFNGVSLLRSDELGLGAVGSLRYHLIGRGPLAPYIDAGGGTLLTAEPFPPDGTWWNFAYRLGFGFDFALGGTARIAIGFRHVHFSNGKRIRFENPAYNGNGLALGVSW